jgi:hypothetical protein
LGRITAEFQPKVLNYIVILYPGFSRLLRLPMGIGGCRKTGADPAAEQKMATCSGVGTCVANKRVGVRREKVEHRAWSLCGRGHGFGPCGALGRDFARDLGGASLGSR